MNERNVIVVVVLCAPEVDTLHLLTLLALGIYLLHMEHHHLNLQSHLRTQGFPMNYHTCISVPRAPRHTRQIIMANIGLRHQGVIHRNYLSIIMQSTNITREPWRIHVTFFVITFVLDGVFSCSIQIDYSHKGIYFMVGTVMKMGGVSYTSV